MNIKNYDQTIEENIRRKQGAFYTPTIFVDYAHKMIEEQFGADWKEKYVVWDCAWGTGNLTRDYKFKELYCSTLEQAELDIARDVNKDATKFKFDFLNDDFEDLPDGLKQAFIEKKPILFLINPPYSTANSSKRTKDNGNIIGIKHDRNKIQDEMKSDGMGAAGQEVYNRFLYRICKLKEQFNNDINLALFCKPGFMTGSKNIKFRSKFLDNFNFIDGIIFNAGHFANVSANWAITFNTWGSSGIDERHNFKHNVVDTVDGSITKIGEKTLYNTDGLVSASQFWRSALNKLKRTETVLALKGALAPATVENLVANSIGSFHSSGNSCSQFANYYWILSTASNRMGNAVCITPDNFYQSMMTLAVTKTAEVNWLTDKDEMMYPNIDHPKFNDFKNDAVVFSLFESASQQSSLRNVEMEGKTWNVKNEFFFMGRDEMMDLADNYGFDELYKDAENSQNRFVYNVLNDIEISPEAQAVLDKAREIVRKSFKYRKGVHENKPEYHLNTWDAGWYQIKKLANEIPELKVDLLEFRSIFKTFKEKMRPMVYELGFLRK